MKRITTYLKEIMNKANVSAQEASSCIGVSVGTFRNKLSQDRFSVDDLIILAEMCNYHLAFISSDNKNIELLDVSSYISDDDIRKNIEEYHNNKLQKNLKIVESCMKNMNKEERESFIKQITNKV